MMKFGDVVRNDIDRAFLNMDEFAEENHIVEEESIRCIFTSEQLHQNKGIDLFGAYNADVCLMAKTDDLPPRRGYGMNLNVDGADYMIVNWSDDFGMSTIMMTTGTR